MASTPRPYSICVFCGSSARAAPERLDEAAAVGRMIAEQGARLVYGGGGVGLMGACSTAARDAGGAVLGVIPQFLTHVEAAPSGAEIMVVASMHERKRTMFEESDAFVVLPGAIGTLEEMIELVSWRRLGLHDKPILIFNPEGFWDPLFTLFDRFVAEALLPAALSRCGSIERLEDLILAIGGLPESVHGPPGQGRRDVPRATADLL